jgi:hypothetical protein
MELPQIKDKLNVDLCKQTASLRHMKHQTTVLTRFVFGNKFYMKLKVTESTTFIMSVTDLKSSFLQLPQSLFLLSAKVRCVYQF